MLVLLPPSETKRDGGEGAPLALDALSHPALRTRRAELVDGLIELSADPSAAMRALKLGPRGAAEVERNRRLLETPTMAALDRYTGVLYDALDFVSLDAASRAFAADSVMVHSALFGLVGALDPIPAYRLSHDSRIPGIRLRSHWSASLTELLDARSGVIVDLRSEGYAELGPLPSRHDAVFVRVVSVGADGRRRALNHFNKQAKGRFTRTFLEHRPDIANADELLEWARAAGFLLERRTASADGGKRNVLELVA
jgi:cytoplasmic iron level regulating protein YaaA (DUF328/UPF0246 family)